MAVSEVLGLSFKTMEKRDRVVAGPPAVSMLGLVRLASVSL